MKKCSTEELSDYFHYLTSHRRQSEIIVGLAYAVLCGILLHLREGNRVEIDVTRLLWGEQIAVQVSGATISTNVSTVITTLPKPTMQVASLGTGTTSIILGPDGRPAPTRKVSNA